VSGSAVAARLAGRVAPHVLVAVGCAAMSIGLLYLSRAPIPGTYLIDVMPGLMLLGFGRGLSAPAHVAIALEGVAERDAGAASGLLNTSIQLGAALGLTAIATLAAQASGAAIEDGASAASAMVTGTRAALAALAVAAAASGVAAATAMRPSRLRDRVGPTGGLALG